MTPAGQSRSRRSKGTWRRGKGSSSPSLAPQVAANVSASAASSSSSWMPLSLIRRGSTSTTWAPRPSRSGQHPLAGRRGTGATTPCRRTARLARGAPTPRSPRAAAPRSDSAAAASSGVTTSSRHPYRATARRSCDDRWSLTENAVRRSTSSPHRSRRTGSSAVEGNTSTMPPRTANSPRCSTWCSRR